MGLYAQDNWRHIQSLWEHKIVMALSFVCKRYFEVTY